VRGFNWQIWAGLLLSVVTFLSWPFLFVRWPATRNVPWANLLLLGASAVLLVMGVRRGYARGPRRALRILLSSAVAVLSVLVLVNFLFVTFVAARNLPVSQAAPQVGEKAPDFTLLDQDGKSVSLSELLSGSPKGVVLIFYMYSGCRACNSELHDVQQNLPTFADAGIRPVAISVDVPEVSRKLSEEAGYTYTFLSDQKLDVIRRYDLVQDDHGSRPADFLLDSSGVVRWRNIPGSYYVRARPVEIVEAASALR